jgi:hypothetical protein
MRRLLTCLLLAAAAPLGAAPGFAVKVDSKGVLYVSAATLKKLGLKKAEDGTIPVQFPRDLLPAPKVLPPRAPERPAPDDRIVMWAPLRRDGSLRVVKTRLPGGRGSLPGAPGTHYIATSKEGRLVLLRPTVRSRR